MQMAIFMKANGLTIKQKDMELILIQMAHTTKDNGLTINNMDKELSHGQMVLVMKAATRMERKKAKED